MPEKIVFFENSVFSENASNVFRSHFAGEI